MDGFLVILSPGSIRDLSYMEPCLENHLYKCNNIFFHSSMSHSPLQRSHSLYILFCLKFYVCAACYVLLKCPCNNKYYVM